MKKKYKEQKEESKIIVEEDHIDKITNILNKHLFFYAELPQQIEISVQRKSVTKIMKMSDLFIEENVLFAYRVPDPSSNGRNSIQKVISPKQLSKEKTFNPPTLENNYEPYVNSLHFTTNYNDVSVPIKNIVPPITLNTQPTRKNESFIGNNYKVLLIIWYLCYILMIILGLVISTFIYFVFIGEINFSFSNLMYYIIAFIFKFALFGGICGIKEVKCFNQDIKDGNNKEKSISYLNTTLWITLGLSLLLVGYGNFIWNNKILMNHLANDLYLNYLAISLFLTCLAALILNKQMHLYRTNKMNNELTRPLLE